MVPKKCTKKYLTFLALIKFVTCEATGVNSSSPLTHPENPATWFYSYLNLTVRLLRYIFATDGITLKNKNMALRVAEVDLLSSDLLSTRQVY